MVMLVALGAIGDHSSSVGLRADHHEMVVVVAETAQSTFVEHRAAAEGDSAIHCGSAMLGLQASADAVPLSCTGPVQSLAFVTLAGVAQAPEPDPPRPMV